MDTEPVITASTEPQSAWTRFVEWTPAWLTLVMLIVALIGFINQRSLPPAPGKPAEAITLDSLPDFQLIERSGQPFRRQDLADQVWVFSFIFTRCHDSCPMVTGMMSKLRGELPTDIKLATISVDPEHDRPDVLTTYADRQTGAERAWLFLTGDKEQVYNLIQAGFKLAVGENPHYQEAGGGERFSHSRRLVLVDRQGRPRGFFDAGDPAAMADLQRQAAKVVKEGQP